jgi:hypothetical protein
VLDAENHQVADVVGADAGGGRDTALGFAVVAVEGERDTDLLAVVAGDLKAARAPARVASIY